MGAAQGRGGAVVSRVRKLRLVPPIDRLRDQVARARQLTAELRARLAEAEQAAAREEAALAAAEARRAAKRSPGYRAFVDARRAMVGGEGDSR